MRTNTLFVKIDKLLAFDEDNAFLMVRLMQACNDIALANQCLGEFKNANLSPIRQHTRRGACMYFIRLQCSHLKEAMDLLYELKNKLKHDNTIKHIFEKCPNYSKEAFKAITPHIKGKNNYSDDFMKYIIVFRNKVGFHYDKDFFGNAVKKRANNPAGNRTTITRGSNTNLWRFNLADDIVDTLVCREIWKIKNNGNLHAEADKYTDFVSNLCKDYLDFCGEFIFQYIREHGAE